MCPFNEAQIDLSTKANVISQHKLELHHLVACKHGY